MEDNTDAPIQPPLISTYSETVPAHLISLLQAQVPLTLTQHVHLVALQIGARVYEEELKLFVDAASRDAFGHVATELVLWHYRHDLKGVPRKFEPMHDLAEFIKILCREPPPLSEFRREFRFPFARPCGAFRDGESAGSRDNGQNGQLRI